jgi:hypothetical protein
MTQKNDLSVYAMVHTVLAESKEKLASESSGLDKTAAVAEPEPQKPVSGYADFLKIADACDHLSGRLHLIEDTRTSAEKLAEFDEVQRALNKEAFSVGGAAPAEPSQPSDAGDNSTGTHQTQTADEDSQSPKTVTPDDSGTGVGAGNAIPSEQTDSPGTGIEAGQGGAATPGHQSPKAVQPTEKANPQDASNAVETNQEMMMPEQPVDILKQSAANSPTLQALVAQKRGSAAHQVKMASVLLHKAAESGIPADVTLAMIRTRFGDGIAKLAEDALNPAQISGNTKPILQTEPGVPSQLSQGAEAGSNTPRETAPTSGEGGGRELLSSVEAAINATKGKAKQQNKGALNEVLTEPPMSKAHDKTLAESLDNTSGAGVKISSAQADAARELLRKFQDSSPENKQKLAALAKLSQAPEMAAGGGVPPTAGGDMAPAPEDEIGDALEEEGGEGLEGPSPEAMEAAKAGVTPEEIAQAEELLAAQGAEAAEAAAAEEEAGAGAPMPPEAAAGVPGAGGEKAGQGGMGAGMMGSAPSMT